MAGYEKKHNTNTSINNVIKIVKKDSIADEIGIKPGFKLLKINEQDIIDILDYKFLISDEYVELEVLNLENELEIYEIEKDEDDELGIEFESELIDEAKNCHNNCIFCFMNQLPKDVRDTLIFKDDDYRLSFFSGNYITMTNMKDNDIDRIIRYRLSPINISVHATDVDVRCKMLNNRFAGKVLTYIEKLYNAGINMNTQVVLCKGINDGKILEKTIKDLSKYFPMIRCIGIVPVGLTKHRDDLETLKPLTKEDCINTINIVKSYQDKFKKKYKDNVVYLADEFYLKADMDIPNYTEYGDFENIENGIGMLADFNYEFDKHLTKILKKKQVENKTTNKINVHIFTGKITKEFIAKKSEVLTEKLCDNLNIKVEGITNTFFGEEITVTGLITGQDIINHIEELKSENKLFKDDIIIIPNICLKEDEDIFLDDVTLKDVILSHKNIIVTDNTAISFIDTLSIINSNSTTKIKKLIERKEV